MPKVIVASFAAITLIAVTAGVASAATPLDPTGDLAGYVPPSKSALSCTRYVNKRITIMPLVCALGCAVDFAANVSRGLPADNTYCETTWSFSCFNQYERAMDKLDQGTCLNCLDEPAREGLYPLYRGAVSTAKDQIFCDNNPANTPFPDGHGFVSENRDTVKCQNTIMRGLIKASKCLNLKCHQRLAEGLFHQKPHLDNAACEETNAVKSCKAHFQKTTADLTGCPACVNLDTIWTSFQDALALNNGEIYCTDDP